MSYYPLGITVDSFWSMYLSQGSSFEHANNMGLRPTELVWTKTKVKSNSSMKHFIYYKFAKCVNNHNVLPFLPSIHNPVV